MSSDQQQAEPTAQQEQINSNGVPPGLKHPFATGSLQGMKASPSPGLEDKTATSLAGFAAPVLPAAASASPSAIASVVNPSSVKKIPPEAAAAIALAPPIVNPPTVIPDDNEATPIQPASEKVDAAAATPMEVELPAAIPSPKQRKRAAGKSLLKKAIRPLEPTSHASGRPARSTAATDPPATEPQAKKGSKKDQDQDNEPLSKMYAKKTQKKVSSPKKKASKPAKTTSARGAAVLLSEGAPDEPLEGGWPTGWIRRIFERKGGATKGQSDRYWYTPIAAYKLRSMVQVKKFLAALADGGDEETAKRTMMNY